MNPADIRGLEEYWARNTQRAASTSSPAADQVLLSLLGLGIGQALDILHREQPGLQEFADWIVAQSGEPDPVEIARYHAALDGAPPPHAAQELLGALDAAAPTLDDADLRFWDANGYVVVRAAISRAEAAAAADVLWRHVGASPADPESWYGPAARGLWVPLWQAPELDVARKSVRVRKAFAQIWGTPDLWTVHDRMSFNQPVRHDSPFLGSPLHIDTSLAPPMPLGTQAIIYLTDTPAHHGALQVVPGFHRDFDRWLAGLNGADPRSADLYAGAMPVPGKAGDMVIWHHALPHGATPNRGDFPRIVQYLNMMPAGPEDRREWI